MKQQQKVQKGKVFSNHIISTISPPYCNIHALDLIEIDCNIILQKYFKIL